MTQEYVPMPDETEHPDAGLGGQSDEGVVPAAPARKIKFVIGLVAVLFVVLSGSILVGQLLVQEPTPEPMVENTAPTQPSYIDAETQAILDANDAYMAELDAQAAAEGVDTSERDIDAETQAILDANDAYMAELDAQAAAE